MSTPENIRQLVREEVRRALIEDSEVRHAAQTAVRETLADQENRFDRLIEELRLAREEDSRRWEEQAKRWDEQAKRWDEQAKRWDEQAKRWDEQAKRWEEQNLRWKEDQKVIRAMLRRLDNFDSRLGALGARWGLHSEEAFRSALQGILEASFGVKVINLRDWDDSGEVFGRPDQVELDVIIYNATLILCEIKSAVSKGDIALFNRKVKWYEQRHNRKADRCIVISPLADTRARQFARELGIEVYSFARDVRPSPSSDQ